MSRKVTYARLHSGVHLPSAGDFGTVFPNPNKTLEGLDMQMHENHLTISFTYRGLKKEIGVPFGNLIVMELAQEEPKVKVAK